MQKYNYHKLSDKHQIIQDYMTDPPLKEYSTVLALYASKIVKLTMGNKRKQA